MYHEFANHVFWENGQLAIFVELACYIKEKFNFYRTKLIINIFVFGLSEYKFVAFFHNLAISRNY